MTEQAEMNWSIVSTFWPQIKTVVKVSLLLVLLDIAISFGASCFLSDSYYLEKYLSDKKINKGQDVDKTLADYFSDAYFIRPDAVAGWINTPNVNQPEWRTNAIGAQISPDSPNTGDTIQNSEQLVFLLGSSVINGYGQPFEQRPVGLLEAHGYDVVDFSTAMYSIDQSWAFYENVLSAYKPKAIIVGVHNDAEVIPNMFLPFRSPDATAPFIKPAYTMSDTGVVKKLPPVDALREKDFASLLAALKEGDAQYPLFEAYQRLSLLPFSNFVWHLVYKFKTNFYSVDDYTATMDLQKEFMQKFVEKARQQGSKVIFVKFESRYDLEPSYSKRFISRYLHEDKTALHNAYLKSTEMPILYSTEIFQATGRPMSDFFIAHDWLHFSAEGNALLAEAIHQAIER